MSDIPYVDFRNGMVSERLRRRSDLSFYANSASLIENAVPLRTGGVVQREGLSKQVSGVLGGAVKIVPIVKDDSHYFILAFSPKTSTANGKMYVCSPKKNASGEIIDGFDAVEKENAIYDAEDLKTICVAHTFDKIVIAQKNHYPQVITYNSDSTSITGMSEFSPKAKYDIYKDGELQSTSTETFQYITYLNKNNSNWNPAGCAFVANRLVFYGFKASPYAFVMSHPFEYDNFTDEVKYSRTTSKMTSEKYLDAVAQLQETSTTEETNYVYGGKTYAKVYKKMESAVSSTGYYMTTITYVDDATAQVIHTEVATRKFNTTPVWNSTTKKWTFDRSTETENGAVYFETESTTYVNTITDDCAIFLELASDRDERICWLGQVGDYVYIGTTSSEWIMPSSVTATQVQCSKLSSYGSAGNVRCAYGMRNLFHVQIGSKKIRSIQYTQDGPSFSEISYTCPELFENGIDEIVWQKVPEPRMYVRNKGNSKSISVYCYDTDYGVNAWCRWTFSQYVKSICVLDTNKGQEVFVLMDDGYLYKFVEGKYTDDTGSTSVGFIPCVTTNNIENSTALAFGKKNYTIYADTNGTNFSACTTSPAGNTTPVPCRVVNNQLSKIEAYTVFPKDQGLRIKIVGKEKEAFTLLALIIDMEISR